MAHGAIAFGVHKQGPVAAACCRRVGTVINSKYGQPAVGEIKLLKNNLSYFCTCSLKAG